MDRATILVNLGIAFQEISKLDPTNAILFLNRAFDQLLDANYFPLLEFVLQLRVSMDLRTDNHKQLFIDCLIRTSEYLHCPMLETRWAELLAYASELPEMTLQFPANPRLVNLLPFRFAVRFEPDEVRPGDTADLIFTFRSATRCSFTIDDIALNLMRKGVRVHDLSEQIGPIESKRPALFTFHRSRVYQEGVWSEKVVTIDLVIRGIRFRFRLPAPVSVKVLPPDFPCRLEAKLPALFFSECSTKISFRLFADTDPLARLVVEINSHDLESGRSLPALHGSCGTIQLVQAELVALPDVPVNGTLDFELFVCSQKAGTYDVTWTVHYTTARFGPCSVEQQHRIHFQDPFFVDARFSDANFHPIVFGDVVKRNTIVKQLPIGVNDSVVYLQTMLRNNVGFPLRISSIQPTFQVLGPNEFPILLAEGESFVFIGTVDFRVPHRLEVRYDFPDIETGVFVYAYDEILPLDRTIHASLNAPGEVVRNRPFQATLRLENISENVVLVEVACSPSRNFLVDGPGKRLIPLFGTQCKIVDFTVVALSTGSETLPMIKVGKYDSPQDQQMIQHPIIVVHN
jgi:hypothetical protein